MILNLNFREYLLIRRYFFSRLLLLQILFQPYTMRICVLSVLKELIINVLNNDELDELQRKTRDDYIIIMQDHLLDVNAFVRSKVST